MRKTGIILFLLLLLITGGYLFIRYYLLRANDFKPDRSKAISPLDLRPALIAKLKQVIRDASHGLYILSLDSIEPHMRNASVDLIHARIRVDSSVLASLDALQQAPDDVYAVSFRKMTVSGLGIAELLNRRRIDLDRIVISDPEMTLFRKERPYNLAKRKLRDTLTLQQRITQHLDHISVDSIRIENGSFISKNLLARGRDTRFDHLTVNMHRLLIDSASHRDTSRFFFTENTSVSCGFLQRRTSDSLYLLEADSLLLNAKAHTLTAFRVLLKPRGNKTIFRKKLRHRGDRFHISVPRLTLSGMHWWQLFNKGILRADRMDIHGGVLKDYVDGSLPPRPKIKLRNFPYQTLHGLSLPIHISRVNIHGFSIAYTEYYPPSGRDGTLYFDDINGSISNLINIPGNIKAGIWCRVDATTRFMHSIYGRIRMGFDMNRYRSGVYTADINLGSFPGTVLNPVTENLSLFTIKQGTADSCRMHIAGNNTNTTATVRLLYHDLHIITLRKKEDDNGRLKKKNLLSFFMNTLVIRNANPGRKDHPREITATLTRDGSPSFFNFCWRAMRYGILSTVGIPKAFIPQ